MSRKNVRVTIPRNADELITLGESIVARHGALGPASPLQGLDMAAFIIKLAEAKAVNAQAKQLRKDSETATEDRDGLLGHKKDQNSNTPDTILNIVVRSRDILLGAYKGNEQHLGDYGFDVNQSSSSSNGAAGATSQPTDPETSNPSA